MATDGNTQKIIVSGLAAGEPQTETAIILFDESGTTLEKALIEDDGCCELSEDALARATAMAITPVGLGIEVENVRSLVSSDGYIDIGALLYGGPEPFAGRDDLRITLCRREQRPPPWH